MPFHIETFDKPEQPTLRLRLRPQHLEFLDRNAKLLIACGGKLGDDGSNAGGGVYIVDLDTRAEAERFIEGDPYHEAGLFGEVRITRWRKAYVDGKSFLPKP